MTTQHVQGNLEARLTGRGGQFFVGNSLTWADLHLFSVADRLRLDQAEVRDLRKMLKLTILLSQILEKYPKLKDLVERIENEPNIAKWLKSRPQTKVIGQW